MRKFYLTYRAKVQTVSGPFDVPFPLSWSHYVRLLTVTDNAASAYYEHDAPPSGPANDAATAYPADRRS